MNYMKIKEVFEKCSEEGRSALTIFVSCGDHGLEFTEKLVESLAKSGADMVELGVPFSDPTADGKTIQEAGQRALGCGTTLEGIFEMVKKLRRKGVQIPFILFSYMNPLFKMGLSKAAKKSSESGVNGWLVVDAPFEESEEIVSACAPEGLDVIELVSPLTPPERVEKISKRGSGFLYYVMLAGVTGARKNLPENFSRKLAEVKERSSLPVGAGFGISSPESAREVAMEADSVIVGSGLIDLVHSKYVESGEEEALRAAESFVESLSKAMSRG